MRLRVYSFLATLPLTAVCCQAAEPVTPTGSSRATTATKTQHASATSTAPAPQGASIGASNSAAADAAQAAAPIDYPALAFNGQGFTTAKLSNQLKSQSRIGSSLDETKLDLTMTSMSINCGDLAGCDQSQLDQAAQQQLGVTTYARVSDADLVSLAAHGFRNESFALFASSITAPDGVVFTFDQPLPVYPWPAATSRYDSLNAGPITWNANVTTSQPLPDTGVTQFAVAVTVSKGTTFGTQLSLTFQMRIAQDTDWKIYRAFPMPYNNLYSIDTTAKNIMTMATEGRTYSDDSGSQERSSMSFRLCSKATPGQAAQQFSCN